MKHEIDFLRTYHKILVMYISYYLQNSKRWWLKKITVNCQQVLNIFFDNLIQLIITNMQQLE